MSSSLARQAPSSEPRRRSMSSRKGSRLSGSKSAGCASIQANSAVPGVVLAPRVEQRDERARRRASRCPPHEIGGSRIGDPTGASETLHRVERHHIGVCSPERDGRSAFGVGCWRHTEQGVRNAHAPRSARRCVRPRGPASERGQDDRLRQSSLLERSECDLVCSCEVAHLEDLETLMVEVASGTGIRNIRSIVAMATRIDRRGAVGALQSFPGAVGISRGEAG